MEDNLPLAGEYAPPAILDQKDQWLVTTERFLMPRSKICLMSFLSS